MKSKKKKTGKNPKYLGLRAYANYRGVALSSVQQAISEGRISVELINFAKKIDVKKADAEWAKNTGDQKRFMSNKVNGTSYQEQRTIREQYQAKLAKLEYEEKSEKLVDAETVKREAFEEGRRVRDALMNIPGRVSGLLKSCKTSFEIEQVLDREISKVLELLSERGP